MKKKDENDVHPCSKSDIKWDKAPDYSGTETVGGHIPWYGKCNVCGRRVYEIYSQQDELWDAELNETVADLTGQEDLDEDEEDYEDEDQEID